MKHPIIIAAEEFLQSDSMDAVEAKQLLSDVLQMWTDHETVDGHCVFCELERLKIKLAAAEVKNN